MSLLPIIVASFLAAAVLVTWIVGSWAAAEEARPISSAQLQKLLTFVDAIGAKEEFPAPTAQNLGVSHDPNVVLPVTVVVTNDHKVYFCRGELNPADYIIWVRTSSYMFLTDANLKLVRALHLRANGFPDVLNSPPAQIEAIYKDALLALGKDVDHSR